MLSNLSHANNESEAYESPTEADHEYEVLDKYNQTYEEVIQAPPTKPEPIQLQPSSSADDYDFTQCPAYIPVTTNSTYVNINTPSLYPITTIEDDQLA